MKLRARDVLALLSELTVVTSGIRCAPLYCSTYDRTGVGPPPSIGAVLVVQVIHVLAPQHLVALPLEQRRKIVRRFLRRIQIGHMRLDAKPARHARPGAGMPMVMNYS